MNFSFVTSVLKIFINLIIWCVHAQSLQPCLTLLAVAHQAPLSMGFSGQEYWSGLPCPPPGDLPNPRIKPTSLMSSALASGFFTTSAIWEAPIISYQSLKNHWKIAFSLFSSLYFSSSFCFNIILCHDRSPQWTRNKERPQLDKEYLQKTNN